MGAKELYSFFQNGNTNDAHLAYEIIYEEPVSPGDNFEEPVGESLIKWPLIYHCIARDMVKSAISLIARGASLQPDFNRKTPEHSYRDVSCFARHMFQEGIISARTYVEVAALVYYAGCLKVADASLIAKALLRWNETGVVLDFEPQNTGPMIEYLMEEILNYMVQRGLERGNRKEFITEQIAEYLKQNELLEAKDGWPDPEILTSDAEYAKSIIFKNAEMRNTSKAKYKN